MRINFMIVVLPIYASVIAAAVVRGPSPTVVQRDLTDVPPSITKLIGSAIPSDAAGGILPGWLKIPTEDEIKKQLGLNDTTISSLPIQVCLLVFPLFMAVLTIEPITRIDYEYSVSEILHIDVDQIVTF